MCVECGSNWFNLSLLGRSQVTGVTGVIGSHKDIYYIIYIFILFIQFSLKYKIYLEIYIHNHFTMASTITPKLNLSLRPRQINNQPLSIFNPDTDFKTDSDVTYVNVEGDTMTGELTVPNLTVNNGITLPSVYTALPTPTQLGGVYKSTISTPTTDTMRSTQTTYATLSLPAGCYMVYYSYQLKNDLGTKPRPTIIFNNIQGGFSTFVGDCPPETKHFQYGYNQGVGDEAFISLIGSTFYQHHNSTNRTIYMNCLVLGSGNVTVTAVFTAVRVG